MVEGPIGARIVPPPPARLRKLGDNPPPLQKPLQVHDSLWLVRVAVRTEPVADLLLLVLREFGLGSGSIDLMGAI